ncbi:MAG: calcium:proton antiporter [bacterium]
MESDKKSLLPILGKVLPPAALGVFGVCHFITPGYFLTFVVFASIIAAVMVAVYHAEAIAHRIGDPMGTLVLALAVTIIEVSLIISMMVSGGDDATELARDAVFSTVMIVCNGVVGLSLMAGSLKHRVVTFRVEGTSPALAVLATLATLTLVMPTYTTTTPGPSFSRGQLIFAGLVSLTLYGIFLFVQSVRHREDYLQPMLADEFEEEPHSPSGNLWIHLGLLAMSLLAVVGLADELSPAIERGIDAAGLPHAVVGLAIALLVLMPEMASAFRAAYRNRMQVSFNLAFGSALATIGLTIPVVAVAATLLQMKLDLGLPPKDTAMLAITLLVTSLTVSSGTATVLQGAVHLVLFAVFIFLSVIP